MISKVVIANLALSRFGGGKITAFDDGTESARLIDLNYENCVDTVLRAFPWNFARKIELLSLSDSTTPGYQYVYQYPAKCVNVIKVYSEGNSRLQEKPEFKIFTDGDEKFIACDIEKSYVEFTYKDNPPDVYDPLFIKALSYILAAEICNAKSGNAQKAGEMLQKYQLAINEAHLAGAIENNEPYEWPKKWTDGRR